MTGTLLIAVPPSFAVPPNFAVEDNQVNPGVLGFLVVALLGGATWLLIRSMSHQLKKIDFTERDDGVDVGSREAGGRAREVGGSQEAGGEAFEPGGAPDDYLRAVTVGPPVRLDGPIVFAAYDPRWPQVFAEEARRVRAALAGRVLLLEHAGSTSVPGLLAKPIIDMLLAVADSAREDDYVPALEAAGFVLRIREPEWHQHRLFKGPGADVNLHVFTVGSAEIERMLTFRDRLREHEASRERYAQAKRALASRNWEYVQHYADAKSEVVEEIIRDAQSRLP